MTDVELSMRIDTSARQIMERISQHPNLTEREVLSQLFGGLNADQRALNAWNRNNANRIIQSQVADIAALNERAGRVIHVSENIQSGNENPTPSFWESSGAWALDLLNGVGAFLTAHPSLTASGVAIGVMGLSAQVSMLYGSEIAAFTERAWTLVAGEVNGLLISNPRAIVVTIVGGGVTWILVSRIILQRNQRSVHA
jgi:hypothetical protein